MHSIYVLCAWLPRAASVQNAQVSAFSLSTRFHSFQAAEEVAAVPVFSYIPEKKCMYM